MAGSTVNPRGGFLSIGPSNPGLGYVVKPERLGDRKFSQDVGGEIRWHPYLFVIVIEWRSW